MSIGSIFNIAGTAMSAQSLRLNTVASNLANAQTAGSSPQDVYKARHPVFATIERDVMQRNMDQGIFEQSDGLASASAGVRVLGIVESDAEALRRYEPNHTLANEEGYVFYSNVNVIEEMTDMMAASRSFKLNVDTMEAAKAMMQRVITLGR